MVKSWGDSVRPENSMDPLIAGNVSSHGASASGVPELEQVLTGVEGPYQLGAFLRAIADTLGH